MAYAPPPGRPPIPAASISASAGPRRHHTNQVIEAGLIRARDEQQMQNLLQQTQMWAGIYNTDIEPEHDCDYYCSCPAHVYMRAKWARLGAHDMWSRAVKYPGEKTYNDINNGGGSVLNFGNPYKFRVVSPYGYGRMSSYTGRLKPDPGWHAKSVQQMIALNAQLNAQAQASIDAMEPKQSIWGTDLDTSLEKLSISASGKNEKESGEKQTGEEQPGEKQMGEKQMSERQRGEKQPMPSPSSNGTGTPEGGPNAKLSRFASFRKSLGFQSTEQKAHSNLRKKFDSVQGLRDAILQEEAGRWHDDMDRNIVAVYQEKTGMAKKIAALRQRAPIQYLHLLRAGYFEPIPVAWANLASNPLKFSIEPAGGWRGITPAWRGYEDTAEERLYWVLNHREGSVGVRMKPDFISEMNMARDRMALAVEPPPQYYTPDDTCHIQHTSDGYSKQVMPKPFHAFDAPETPTDDTMILLDVSGSMNFDPLRPIYNKYLITGYANSTQPKNKDVAKAIIRRFTDAMANHDREFNGYDLLTFSSKAEYIGKITHRNLDSSWNKVKIGGGTRVMTGWQLAKDLHFRKHHRSATHHPIFGWQAGLETPMLRLLLLLDGEATDMDEFELDLLGLSWAHVTIFLIGVDGCPHHHRHANELQRISDVNHHVSFVDAQGNTPERFVTHELLKRHLGQDITMSEFEDMEQLPAYS